MPYSIIRNDITKMHVDAIVNPTDRQYSGRGGTDFCIHEAAGSALDAACSELPPLWEGMVAVTSGFRLPCRYVLHTIGPVWRGGGYGEREQLLDCYRNALLAAEERHCETIAFPLIASGTFGYPKDQVLRIALEAVTAFLLSRDMTVYIVVYDRESYSIGQKLQQNIDSYIDENYVDEAEWFCNRRARRQAAARSDTAYHAPMQADAAEESGFSAETFAVADAAPQAAKNASLEEMLSTMDESFSGALFRLIDAKGMTDAQCYKKANIDKKLFSKIRNPEYHPSKPTILALAIALELNLDETKALLEKAGLALSNSSRFDVIVQYFIVNQNYDLMEINETLYHYDQNLLGNVIA